MGYNLCIHDCIRKRQSVPSQEYTRKVAETLPLKVVTYLDYVDLGLPNHSEVYNIIKAATS